MRKMKKINGYLVVRFNDRERREYPELGGFGVIDAEQYTGEIDIDLSAMEYSDAGTIEVAVEQARGLESEEDLAEEAPVITVSVETNSSYTEEIVEPEQLIRGMTARLRAQIQGRTGLDLAAATHELHGFKTALHRLGFLPEIETKVDPEQFADCAPAAAKLTMNPTTLTDKELRELQGLLGEIYDYARTPAPPGDRFRNLTLTDENAPLARKIYQLGNLLEHDCPDNDCIIYRNTFRMARELDTALDGIDGYAARVVQHQLQKHVLDLQRMYCENYAIMQYKYGRWLDPGRSMRQPHDRRGEAPTEREEAGV